MTGSPVYENWQAHIRGGGEDVVFEFPLYSDMDAIPEVRGELGPYQILHSGREVPSLQDCPALILRIIRHEWPRHEQAGDSIPEEFASLLSLLSGTRLAAGSNYTRRFGFDDDPLGQPIFTHETMVVPKPTLFASVLPQVATRRGIDVLLLQSLPKLSSAESLIVAKAARLYRVALWYSESQQEFSWLMFVSALETAAGFWQKGRLSPEEQLSEMRPKLHELLLSAGGQELLQAASKELADYMGATRKFVMFVSTFAPELVSKLDEPDKTLRAVYSARSKALHSGVAIPDDLPMTLSDFEAITRNSLIAWWKSRVSVTLSEEKARRAD